MNFSDDILSKQREVCARKGAEFAPVDTELKVGINPNLRFAHQVLNGLRPSPEGDTCGWYLWAGEEWTDNPDFFVPLHASHLVSWCPLILPYLALPPGWRFLLAGGYEDVWFDPNLLTTST